MLADSCSDMPPSGSGDHSLLSAGRKGSVIVPLNW